jgi:hypothetical protein
MKKIIRLTESDLSKIVRRVIKEQEENNMGYEEQDTTRRQLMLRNKSANVVNRHLNNLSDEIRFIAIVNCEYADFSGIDICGIRNLMFVNVVGTDNNFDEQGYDCFDQMGEGLYYIKGQKM